MHSLVDAIDWTSGARVSYSVSNSIGRSSLRHGAVVVVACGLVLHYGSQKIVREEEEALLNLNILFRCLNYSSGFMYVAP